MKIEINKKYRVKKQGDSSVARKDSIIKVDDFSDGFFRYHIISGTPGRSCSYKFSYNSDFYGYLEEAELPVENYSIF